MHSDSIGIARRQVRKKNDRFLETRVWNTHIYSNKYFRVNNCFLPQPVQRRYVMMAKHITLVISLSSSGEISSVYWFLNWMVSAPLSNISMINSTQFSCFELMKSGELDCTDCSISIDFMFSAIASRKSPEMLTLPSSFVFPTHVVPWEIRSKCYMTAFPEWI